MFTLTKVTRYTTDKNNQPLINRNGKPYTRVNIQVAEHPGKWISGFGSHANASWKEGDQVELEITENGQYLNFKEPSKTSALEERVKTLELKVSILEGKNTYKDSPDNASPDLAGKTEEQINEEIARANAPHKTDEQIAAEMNEPPF